MPDSSRALCPSTATLRAHPLCLGELILVDRLDDLTANRNFASSSAGMIRSMSLTLE